MTVQRVIIVFIFHPTGNSFPVSLLETLSSADMSNSLGHMRLNIMDPDQTALRSSLNRFTVLASVIKLVWIAFEYTQQTYMTFVEQWHVTT